MPTRMRKLVGAFGIVAFLVGYVGLAGAAYRYVPAGPIFTLAYFAVVGTLWGLPLIPFIRWMNGAPRER